jgi:hypothetical protein
MGRRRRFGFLTVIAMAAALVLGSCSTPDAAAAVKDPATLDEVAGADLLRITLTESAAARLDIQTETVATAGDQLVVPSAAVIITPDGSYWVYTNPELLVFVRQEIKPVVEADLRAFFSEGPPAGTPVVVTGVPELYGAEFGIGK